MLPMRQGEHRPPVLSPGPVFAGRPHADVLVVVECLRQGAAKPLGVCRQIGHSQGVSAVSGSGAPYGDCLRRHGRKKKCAKQARVMSPLCALGVVVDKYCLPACRSSAVLLSLMFPAWVAREAGQPGRHLTRGLV